MTKILNDLKKDVYEKVLGKLKKTEDPRKLAQTEYRINGLGNKIEKYNLLENYISQLCSFEFNFGTEEILLTQSEVARQFAAANAGNVGHSEKLHPEIKSNYEEMEKSHLRIAEVLEKAASEIKAIKEEINRQAELIKSAPKPKHSHEHAAQNIAESVRENGWIVMAITGEIPFAYTIGLYKNFKHPEIIVTAIDSHQASSLLNYLCKQVKEGKRFETGTVYEKDDHSHRHVFLKVDNKYRRDYLGTGINFYGGLHFPVIQRVTADKKEIFPWEEGCDPVLKHAQKILGKVELINDNLDLWLSIITVCNFVARNFLNRFLKALGVKPLCIYASNLFHCQRVIFISNYKKRYSYE